MGKILRRSFLIGSAAIAGGVAFGAWKLNRDYPNPLEATLEPGDTTFNPYVKITADGGVTVMVPRAEMGQGVTTTLAAMVAEELDVRLEDVAVEIAPASFAYYNAAMLADGAPLAHYNRGMVAQAMRSSFGVAGKVLGIQATGGSSSTVDAFERMREAGASARETLKLAAYQRTGIATADMTTADGAVVLPDGTSIPYGELAAEAAKVEAVTQVTLRDKSQWRILGTSQPRTDMRAKVTGAPIFGMDVDLPDMVYAALRMNPRLGGPMVSFDATEALKIRDVLDVVDMTGPDSEPFGGGFAVLATNTWAAFMGAQAVVAEWGPAPYPATTAEMDAVLSDTLARGDGDNLRNDGDVDLAFADAPRERVVDVEYAVPYLAHATMEPMNATAQLRDGRLDIWAGTQMPTIVRADCAKEAGVEVTDTYVHSTYLGGGFGRRGEVDFTRFATRLAKSTNGKPVKLVWSREEDMTHDTYRPAARSRWRARLGDDGVPVAIDARIACPSVIGSVMGRMYPSLPMAGPDNTITHGAFDQPYTVADYRVAGIKAPLDVPVGFWRSVGNSYNGFFHESFIDECALAAEMDPLEMRLKLMRDHPTAQNAMRRVAEMANWEARSTDPDRAKGIAFTLSFGCWTAQVVEVSRNASGAISIDRVWCAADVGRALDPQICKAQLMSGIVFGLSSCVGQEITFADGMVEQTNYDDFDALRMTNCPAIVVELIEDAEHMAGIGEPGTPPSIPALANAIARLTGERIRTMPLSKSVTFA